MQTYDHFYFIFLTFDNRIPPKSLHFGVLNFKIFFLAKFYEQKEGWNLASIVVKSWEPIVKSMNRNLLTKYCIE